MSKWTGRVVTDTRGDAGAIVLDDRGGHGDEALAGAWWRCGDVEIAAEYLYAAAYEN